MPNYFQSNYKDMVKSRLSMTNSYLMIPLLTKSIFLYVSFMNLYRKRYNFMLLASVGNTDKYIYITRYF